MPSLSQKWPRLLNNVWKQIHIHKDIYMTINIWSTRKLTQIPLKTRESLPTMGLGLSLCFQSILSKLVLRCSASTSLLNSTASMLNLAQCVFCLFCFLPHCQGLLNSLCCFAGGWVKGRAGKFLLCNKSEQEQRADPAPDTNSCARRCHFHSHFSKENNSSVSPSSSLSLHLRKLPILEWLLFLRDNCPSYNRDFWALKYIQNIYADTHRQCREYRIC